MSTMHTEPNIVSSLIGGSKKPDTNPDPKPDPESNKKHRFYACELKWNSWHCTPTEEKIWNPNPSTLATHLIPVNKWVPEFLDAAVISLKLQKPVLVKREKPF